MRWFSFCLVSALVSEAPQKADTTHIDATKSTQLGSHGIVPLSNPLSHSSFTSLFRHIPSIWMVYRCYITFFKTGWFLNRVFFEQERQRVNPCFTSSGERWMWQPKPEFSNFSWFSMMFGTGIGIGMLGYATGEPMWHMADNADIRVSTEAIGAALTAANITLAEGADFWAWLATQIQLGTINAIDGLVEPKSASTTDAVYRYSFLHREIGAWSCYALVGISFAFFGYSRGLPLTIRSTQAALLGKVSKVLWVILSILLRSLQPF